MCEREREKSEEKKKKKVRTLVSMCTLAIYVLRWSKKNKRTRSIFLLFVNKNKREIVFFFDGSGSDFARSFLLLLSDLPHAPLAHTFETFSFFFKSMDKSLPKKGRIILHNHTKKNHKATLFFSSKKFFWRFLFCFGTYKAANLTAVSEGRGVPCCVRAPASGRRPCSFLRPRCT